jgi:hypothetical protein
MGSPPIGMFFFAVLPGNIGKCMKTDIFFREPEFF